MDRSEEFAWVIEYIVTSFVYFVWKWSASVTLAQAKARQSF